MTRLRWRSSRPRRVFGDLRGQARQGEHMRPATSTAFFRARRRARRTPQQRSHSSRPGAGRVHPSKLWALRPQPASLCAFHFANPGVTPTHRHRALIRALNFGPAVCGAARIRWPTSPNAFRAPSGAPWRPSAKPRPADRGAPGGRASGATFRARIAGVTKSGLFVKLIDTGADGFNSRRESRHDTTVRRAHRALVEPVAARVFGLERGRGGLAGGRAVRRRATLRNAFQRGA